MVWGDTDPDGAKLSVSYSLREVDVPVISNKECKSAKGSVNGYSSNYEDHIFNSMLCTFKRCVSRRFWLVHNILFQMSNFELDLLGYSNMEDVIPSSYRSFEN